MKIEQMLDRIHSEVIKNRLLQIFTAVTRVLLAIGFIPPSIKKIMNQPFTILPDTDPVGHYFNALYHTGFYYQFIGWGQLIAALLLLIPRTSHIGALLFLPIIINITVLTNSVGFKGTWLVTIFMLIASIYLVCWDYGRWKTILFFKRPNQSAFFKSEFIWLPVLFGSGGICLFILFAYLSVGNLTFVHYKFLLILAVIGTLFGLAVAVHHKFMRVEKMEISGEKL